MYPKAIAHYHAPTELVEVLALLEAGGDAKVIAGGQTLMPLLKSRLYSPETLIDLNRVRDLGSIEERPDRLILGAMVRHQQAATHPAIIARCRVLASAAIKVADRQVRNRGTLAGSLAYGDYTSDIAPALLALGAAVRIARHGETERLVDLDAFLIGPFECDLAREELVTAIEIPLDLGRTGGAYVKIGRVAHDRVTVSAGAHVALDGAGRIRVARVGLGGLAPRALRARATEELLAGQTPSATLFEEAGTVAANAVKTRSDELASAEYRTRLIGVTVRQALERAIARAKGESA
ncbi:MAG TPA: FAD binding domain-containing protein [Gammaproteobacteria bacterium]|nr:FAD binding domain-containing protein [Gammaproteobacteria bacterium]